MEPNKPASTHEASQSSHQANSIAASHAKRRTLLWIGLGLGAVIVVVVFLGLRHAGAADQTSQSSKRQTGGQVTVTVAAAAKGDIGVYLDSIGTVTALYTASITSQVNGIVEVVHYREGQFVKKGAALIDIDPRVYQAQLLQAQGMLQRDTHVLEQAQMDLERYRQAWARNSIAKQTLDDQEKLVLQDEGTVKNDQGTVQLEEVELAYCHITAPISGRVGLRLIDPGNVVQSTGDTVLVVITQVEPITIVSTLSEDYLGQVVGQLRHGAKLPVDSFDRTSQTKLGSGVLTSIDNQIDTTTGTVKLRAQFANKNESLFPNQFVNTRLLVNTLRGVTLVQDAAIQHNGQDSFVYVIQNQTAALKNVTTGVSEGGQTQITSGVNPGDMVATSSFEKLQNGSKVTVSSKPVQSNPSGSNAP